MSKGSFRRALREVDRDLASIPHLRELSTARRRWSWRLPLLACAAAVAVVLLVLARRGDDQTTQVAGFTIDAPSTSWHARHDGIEVRASSLDLDVDGFGHVVAARGAVVARIDDGIRVVRGRVDVAVTRRPSREAIVRVSHGTIAVLGTHFTIEQSEHGGRVELHDGRIRFDAAKRSVILNAGESLAWPLAEIARAPSAPAEPPAPIVAPASSSPAPPPSKPTRVEETERSEPPPPPSTAAPALDVDRVFADLANLRARRRFADAAALLEQALAAGLPSSSQERLSYELGDIRTHQLADKDRACRHWQSHRTRFPQGRYTAEIDAAVRRLACEETTP